MKVIDIMQKVANKEIFKFRIDDVNYYVDKSNYICEEDGTKVEWYIDDEWLNMNAEIIEEDKKIEKIEMCTGGIMSFDSVENITTELKNKINELIDEIQAYQEKTREQDIAMQKLEEAVFWLTYGIEE